LPIRANGSAHRSESQPGGIAAGFMLAIWSLAIYNVLVATFVYGL
jgi:hypothetical protein